MTLESELDYIEKVLATRLKYCPVPMSNIPEGRRGLWSVEKFEVSVEAARMNNLRSSIGMCRPILAGSYTRLFHKERGVIMSDTPVERLDHTPFVGAASGNVLVTGLGLGLVTRALLADPAVASVTVIELDLDVIALTAPHIQSDKLTIVNADAYKWLPERNIKFDHVWHDIWDEISPDNLPEMAQLRRHFASRSIGVQKCWVEEICRQMKKSS